MVERTCNNTKRCRCKKAAELAALNIFSVGDLLEFYPRQGAYLDYAKLKTIKELDVDNSKQIFKATVYQVKNGYGASRRSYTSVTVRDETGYATLYFFGGQRYKAQKLKPDTMLQITGRVRQGRTTKSVSEVDVQPLEQDEGKTPGIVPVYALSGNLTQKNLRTWVSEALRLAAKDLPESLPAKVVSQCNLPDRYTALKIFTFRKAGRRCDVPSSALFLRSCFCCSVVCFTIANRAMITERA